MRSPDHQGRNDTCRPPSSVSHATRVLLVDMSRLALHATASLVCHTHTHTHTHTSQTTHITDHTHTDLMTTLTGKPRLAGCPLDSPSKLGIFTMYYYYYYYYYYY